MRILLGEATHERKQRLKTVALIQRQFASVLLCEDVAAISRTARCGDWKRGGRKVGRSVYFDWLGIANNRRSEGTAQHDLLKLFLTK